jgi:hypothetical protein
MEPSHMRMTQNDSIIALILLLGLGLVRDYLKHRGVPCRIIRHDDRSYYCYDRSGLGNATLTFSLQSHKLCLCKHLVLHRLT